MTIPWVPKRHKRIWCATKDVQDEALQTLTVYLNEFQAKNQDDNANAVEDKASSSNDNNGGKALDKNKTARLKSTKGTEFQKDTAYARKGKAKVGSPGPANTNEGNDFRTDADEIIEEELA